ncbi:MAG: hypothetical protein Fues2KO_15610 [Fuerstiella sp.]
MNRSVTPSGLRILVADDDRDIRNGVCLRLRMAGHTVVEAQDGLEALQQVAAGRPDMVILDIRMPKMDGLTVLHHLQLDAANNDIPVVVMSASLVQRDQALDAGAVGFLPKPHDGRELLKIIETVHQFQNCAADPPHGTELLRPRMEPASVPTRKSQHATH